MNPLSIDARAARVPVFAAIGEGKRDRVERLFCDPRVARAASPRHAAIFLVAGPMRLEDREDLRRLHDQMPHPRATLLWDAEVGEALGDVEHLTGETPADGTDAGEAGGVGAPVLDRLAMLWRELAGGERASEPDLLHDEPPNPWKGIGPHGQGGTGMMGGTPYGRAMAMTADDLRDGLALDSYTGRFGPFLPMFPPGLLVEMTLQGDVIQSARVLRPPMTQAGANDRSAALFRLARLLDLLGLPVIGERARLAAAGDPTSVPLERLARAIRWSGARLAIPPGLGAIEELGDMRSRFDGLLSVSQGSMPATRPERPRSAHLSSLLPGLEWSEAMLVLNSFDDETLTALAEVRDEDGDEGDGDGGEGDHLHHDGDRHRGGHTGHAGHEGHGHHGNHGGHA